ncbi:hypothetical protein [Burkholderia latens]|uniref:hypothetical protein n=1 Tax=Burkholderia latens TaxID=488446 RepID=UPI001AE98040|nr:hypothetical protein [Burkholderia latens]QTO46357.1 hypothetical protein J8I85_18095 [Burkholderia latens]
MKDFNHLAQAALPVLMQIPAPRQIEQILIEGCKTYADAVCLCLDKRIRRLNEGEIAEYLGFKGPHLAKVKGGKGYLTSDQEAILQRLCSNTAIEQYAEKRRNDLDRMLKAPDVDPDVAALVERLVAQKLAEAQRARTA